MTDVTEDKDLTPEEKEVMIRFDRRDKRVIVHSEIASVTKALLNRDDFEKTGARTNSEGETVAVTGKLPLGVLKVQQNERQYGSFSNVVSSHD